MFKQVKTEQNPKDKVIAIDGKPANVLQLNVNQLITFRARQLMGLNHHETAVKKQGVKISVSIYNIIKKDGQSA